MLNTEFENILVITQSRPLAKELKKTLSSYKLTIVKNSTEAIKKLLVNKDYAAVLAGIFMEKTRGFEFLDFIKNNPDLYSGPILAVCDSISDDVIEKTKNYDIFDFIVRYSDDLIIKTRIRNAVIYYTEKRKLLTYAVDQVYSNLTDIKLLVNLLAQMMEFKNSESGDHIEHVSIITKFLCKKLKELYPQKYNFSANEIEYISIAAALHDIGKMYIPEEILNKHGKLSDEEFAIMKTHCTLGAAAISRLQKYTDRPIYTYAREVCLYHHERFDGKGYPSGLKGDEIPIHAQIVALADVYDALTSDRYYRKAISHVKALELIMSEKYGKFNKDLITCLIDYNLNIQKIKDNTDYLDLDKDTIQAVISNICNIK